MLIMVQEGEPDRIVDEPMKEGRKLFINFFSIQDLRDYLEKAGFKIIFQEKEPIDDPNSMSGAVIYMAAEK